MSGGGGKAPKVPPEGEKNDRRHTRKSGLATTSSGHEQKCADMNRVRRPQTQSTENEFSYYYLKMAEQLSLRGSVERSLRILFLICNV